MQTEKHIECSTELCKDALSAPYGWYDMESASRQFPNKAADAMEKPTVKVIKEDALKRAYDAAGHSDKVVGILRMTKNNQCPRYMEQQKSDKNQDGDMFRRTDVNRFMTDGWSDEIEEMGCRIHSNMSIFRDTEDQGYAYLPPRQVHAIAAAAVHKPYLSKDFQYENPRDKTLMECN